MNWPLVCNSLAVSGATTFLAVAGGVLAALWFAACEPPRRTLFLAVSYTHLDVYKRQP